MLSLAVGLGVTTAVYSVVDAILWRDTGIDDADRIAVVTAAETSSQDIRWVLSRPDFEDVRRTQRSFDPLTTSYFVNPAVATETATEVYVTEAVDGNYFRALGVDAIAGRTLRDSDDAATASVVVIARRPLAIALWIGSGCRRQDRANRWTAVRDRGRRAGVV